MTKDNWVEGELNGLQERYLGNGKLHFRNNFKGVRAKSTKTNFVIYGSIDDIWLNKDTNEAVILDYKATSTKEEINRLKILASLDEHKKDIESSKRLKGKTLIMIFEKKSLRTRISFELAMKQLGGELLILNPKDSHYGRGGESIHDTAKVLSQYGDIVMMRTHKHENFLKFHKNLDIPIINGLTNLSHPCQILSLIHI